MKTGLFIGSVLLASGMATAGERLNLRTVEAAQNRKNGVTQSVKLTFGGAASANKLYMVYGAADKGVTTEGWDHVVALADIAADETTRTVSVPEGWGTTVTAMRFLAQRPIPGGSVVTYLSSEGANQNGGPFIDTEFTPNQDSRADFTFRQMSAFCQTYQYATPFGVRTASTNQFFVGASLKSDYSQNYWMRRYGSAGIDNGSILPKVPGCHSVSMNKNSFRIDSQTHDMNVYPNKGKQTFTADGPAYVFCVNRTDLDGIKNQVCSPMELFTLDLYDNGTLARAFLPAVKDDGTPALYDPITEKYYLNKSASTVPFTVGPKEYATSALIAETVFPEGVKPIAYIESNGSQYLNTGYCPTGTSRIEASYSVLTYPDNGRSYIFGCYSSGSKIGRTQFAHGTPAFVGYGDTYANGSTNSDGSGNGYIDLGKDSAIHHVIADSGTFTVDGKIAYRILTWGRDTATTAPIYLFGCNGGSTGTATATTPSSIRLYGLRISDGDELKANFIPVTKDGVAGLYDTVSGTFKKSATSTDFIDPPSADVPRLGACTLAATGTMPAEGVTASLHLTGGESAGATVTFYFGTDPETWTARESWSHATAEADYAYATPSTEELALGTTYYGAFKVAFAADGEPVELWSATNQVAFAGNDHWKNSAEAPHDWFNGANWSLGQAPNENLSAVVSNVTGSVSVEDKDIVMKSFVAKSSGYMTIDLKGASTITIPGSLTVGSATTTSSLTGSLALTNGVVNVGGAVNIPSWGTRCTNAHLDLNGTQMFVEGALNDTSNNDSGYNNYLVMRDGALLSVASTTISYGNAMYVNASTVTNRGTLTLAHNMKAGTLSLSNGAYFKQAAGKDAALGGKGGATMNVMGGSTYDGAGSDFYLGGNGDGGGMASTLTVSNSTFTAKKLVAPRGAQFTGNQTLTVKDGSTLTLTENLCLGSWGASSAGAITANVDDSAVTVGTAFQIGTGVGTQKTTLTLKGAGASVTAGSVPIAQSAKIQIVVPETGFTSPLITARKTDAAVGNITFPETLDTKVSVDATACTSGKWQTLFEAKDGGVIGNIVSDTISSKFSVTGTYRNNHSKFRCLKNADGAVTAIQFRVLQGGLIVVVR